MRMRRLGVVVAFDRVGHRLAHGMAGLNATQETALVIWRFRADKRDQFRVYCICQYNILKYKDNTKNFFWRALFLYFT